MAKYEIDTRTVSRTWLERLDSLDGAPVEITKAMVLVAFDNMGKIGFSKDFGTVTTGQGVKWLALLSSLFKQGADIAMVAWPILIANSFGKFGDIAEFGKISAEMSADRFQVRDMDTMPPIYKCGHADVNPSEGRSRPGRLLQVLPRRLPLGKEEVLLQQTRPPRRHGCLPRCCYVSPPWAQRQNGRDVVPVT